MSEFYVGDVIRIQLSPDGDHFRYDFDSCGRCIDYGYGGPWCDAVVQDVDPGEIMKFEYIVPDTGEVLEFTVPLEEHPAYHPELPTLAGWPQPVRIKTVPPCDCGCEAAKDGGTHYSWCSKQTFLEIHGMT